MDVAYDHIQEETLADHEQENDGKKPVATGGLNSEFQEAFKAVSASPWGAWAGGLLGQVKKQVCCHEPSCYTSSTMLTIQFQGESLYTEAQKEYSSASATATKGLTDLTSSIVQKTRDLNISETQGTFTDPLFELPEHDRPKADAAPTDKGASPADSSKAIEQTENLPADILKEASNIASRFQPKAAKWLKEAQKAEDAADEALLKFGTNVRNFLRDTITVTAPDAASAAGLPIPAGWKSGSGSGKSEVLFETNDAEGRRVFHFNRFDAQLHVIHQSPDRFQTDPVDGGEEWTNWAQDFDADKETDRIASDLDKYADLRRTMEKLVPDKVDYADFWRRYYFLRKAVEEEEKKRKEILKGKLIVFLLVMRLGTDYCMAGAVEGEQEDVDWGEDDDDENEKEAKTSDATTPKPDDETPTNSSSTTPAATTKPSVKGPSKADHLSPRRSQEGSDASYDIVSGATTQTTGSPKEEGAKKDQESSAKKAESDEEDWE